MRRRGAGGGAVAGRSAAGCLLAGCLLGACLTLGAGCAGNGVAARGDDAGGIGDAGVTGDAGTPADAGSGGDAGVTGDAGAPPDAGTSDAGTPDAGTSDAGTSDGGCPGGGCGCPGAPTAEVVVYTASAWNVVADALAADPIPCGEVDVSIPATADATGLKTMPRAGQAAAMRARGPGFHALAELHWASWAQVTSMTWYQKGIEFRRRMAAAGYDVAQGDTWAVNELPSSVRSDATVRQHVQDLVQGLYEGPSGAVPARGVVFVVGLGQRTTNLGPYKTNLETWIDDAPFWVDMSSDVRFFAQEVYADPDDVCVDGTTVAQRSQAINAFVEHPARLAAAGPASANTAQSYFHRAYLPLMNAVWGSSNTGYGNTAIPLTAMEHHVSTEVYAARAWAGSHRYPGIRIGFAFARVGGATSAELTTLATRLAASIHDAYQAGGSAPDACSPSGAFTWCQCKLAGAQLNPAWDTAFSTW